MRIFRLIGYGLGSAFTVATLLTYTPQVLAQERDEQWLMNIAKSAFFHVTVEGAILNPETNSPSRETRWGKAFAIGPDILVTARHVLGDRSDWESLQSNSNLAIWRATRPLDRKIGIYGVDDGPIELANVLLPEASQSIDGAAILLPEQWIKQYFELSLCRISDTETYFALMTSADDPTANDSASSGASLVSLTAVGYEPKYQGLYAFDAINLGDVAGKAWGHDGSPIFDDQFNVVAIISAVVTHGAGYRILATPIQPMFPGTSGHSMRSPNNAWIRENNSRCSLADAVKRIHDQVAAHANWRVSPELYTADGSPSDVLVFRYESISANPNINRIIVFFNYWGKEKRTQSRVSMLKINREKDYVILDFNPSSKMFSTTEILQIGHQVVAKRIAEENSNGFVKFLELHIYPVLEILPSMSGAPPPGRPTDIFDLEGCTKCIVPRDPIVREIPWNELRREPD